MSSFKSSPLSEQSELYCANMIRYGPAGARAGVVSEVLLTWAILLSSFLRDTRSKYCYSSISNPDPRQQFPPLQITNAWLIIMCIFSQSRPRCPQRSPESPPGAWPVASGSACLVTCPGWMSSRLWSSGSMTGEQGIWWVQYIVAGLNLLQLCSIWPMQWHKSTDLYKDNIVFGFKGTSLFIKQYKK